MYIIWVAIAVLLKKYAFCNFGHENNNFFCVIEK